MAEGFADGRIVDLILFAVALEALGLAALRRWWRVGPGLRGLAPTLLAGACLLAALRGALSGAAWPWIALALTGALVAHLVDLAARWHSAGSSR